MRLGATATATAVLTSAAALTAGLAPAAAHPAAATGFVVHKQVADTKAGGAGRTDPQLVNAWGLAQSPTGPIWVADNGTSRATVYGGGAKPSKLLSVKVAGEDPSGQVFNPTSSFKVGGTAATFIFDSETGKLSGWAGGNSTVVAASVRRAVFKGLAMATVNGKPELFATDFHHGRIDVFNGSWRRLTVSGFADRRVPTGYAPFGIAALRGKLYVSYAKQDAARHDDEAGRGNGYVDVYSTHGKLIDRLVRRGPLNSPWGMAIAPSGFGTVAGDLLVGNFGNGRINVFNPTSGSSLGALRDAHGTPIVLSGLWGLLPANGTSAPAGTVQFSAGPGGESHGLFGYLSAG